MLGSCRVRGLGRTLTLLIIADKKLEEVCPQIRTIKKYILWEPKMCRLAWQLLGMLGNVLGLLGMLCNVLGMLCNVLGMLATSSASSACLFARS